MITITKLAVSNFKSLHETTIEVLGQTNLFYGFNNSGKSNIFRLLEIIFQRKQLSQNVQYREETATGRQAAITSTLRSTAPFYEGKIVDTPYLFWRNERSTPITFNVFLNVANTLLPDNVRLLAEGFLGENQTELVFTGEIESNNISESTLTIVNATLNGLPFLRFEDGAPIFFEGSATIKRREGIAIMALFDDLVTYIDTDRNFTKEFTKDGVTQFDAKNFKNWLFELNINSDKYEVFNELVKFLGNFEFSEDAKSRLTNNIKSFPFTKDAEIGFSRFGDEVEIMLKNENGRLPLKNYGSGIQQFFYILSRIFSSKSRLIVIEEIELNLSGVFQIEIIQFLKNLMQNNKFDQLYISSHSPYITQKGAHLLDYIHFVTINYLGDVGTKVQTHDNPQELVDDDSGESYFSLLFS